jgi:hypothetical protein
VEEAEVNVEGWAVLNLNPAIWEAIAGTGWCVDLRNCEDRVVR